MHQQHNVSGLRVATKAQIKSQFMTTSNNYCCSKVYSCADLYLCGEGWVKIYVLQHCFPASHSYIYCKHIHTFEFLRITHTVLLMTTTSEMPTVLVFGVVIFAVLVLFFCLLCFVLLQWSYLLLFFLFSFPIHLLPSHRAYTVSC